MAADLGTGRRGAAALAFVLAAGTLACGGYGSDGPRATAAPAPPTHGPTASGTRATAPGAADGTHVTSGDDTRCLVRLHGKGGTGRDTVSGGDVTVIAPTGNSDGWGGRQWLYFPAAEYDAAREIVADSVTGCEQIIVDGFSNGASFAASLYCHGETFDGRLVGVVVDDPVTDHAVDGCTPDPAVPITLYWTGALERTATRGWDCAEGDWTCEGGETTGIAAYAEALATEPLQSPFDEHEWYVDAPETRAWSP